MILQELIDLVSAVPPSAREGLGEILKELLNHDDEAKIVRHTEVLAAKARLGLPAKS